MYEKVNPCHIDKVADRIAGAIVDLAYTLDENPKIAVECLIGHGDCTVIVETSVNIKESEIVRIVDRISPAKVTTRAIVVSQDVHLNTNQLHEIKCGDNGIFKGLPITEEERELSALARRIYKGIPHDGKYVISTESKNEGFNLILCQSNASYSDIISYVEPHKVHNLIINPLGEWTGGSDVDTGAVNRKLGSDMAFAVTGGGIHGKDLSKADVTLNIYAHLKAQETQQPVEIYCAIGDSFVDGKTYAEIVEIARAYINSLGGFEKFAEWGLI